jgi:hypothetical protein
MADYLALAATAYAYAEQHYGDKDARFDVIVECYSLSDIAKELEYSRIADEAGAVEWARTSAGAAHEQELNQAWDGPESVKRSSRYDPAHDAAGPPDLADFCPACGQRSCKGDCSQMDAVMAESADWHRDPAELFRERHGI